MHASTRLAIRDSLCHACPPNISSDSVGIGFSLARLCVVDINRWMHRVQVKLAQVERVRHKISISRARSRKMGERSYWRRTSLTLGLQMCSLSRSDNLTLKIGVGFKVVDQHFTAAVQRALQIESSDPIPVEDIVTTLSELPAWSRWSKEHGSKVHATPAERAAARQQREANLQSDMVARLRNNVESRRAAEMTRIQV